jgi:HK97 family phage portal protein
MPGAVVGLSPIAYMAWSLGLAADALDYGSNFLGGGGHPTSVLSAASALTDDQAQRAKERFKSATEGDKLAVLGGGWTYQAVQISPKDAQMLESRQFSAVEICQFMGVPPEKISAMLPGSAVTYANREQRQQEYATDSLLWWVTNIEEGWSAQLRRGQFVRLNMDALLRPDSDVRSKVIDRKLRNGTLSADEARALDDMEPLPAGQGQLFLWPPVTPAASTQGPAADA